MFEMTGVMTPKSQVIETVAVSPTFQPLKAGSADGVQRAAAQRQVAVDGAGVLEDLLAVAGLDGRVGANQASGFVAASLAAIRAMFWTLM